MFCAVCVCIHNCMFQAGEGRNRTLQWCPLGRPYWETHRCILLRPRNSAKALRQEHVWELRSDGWAGA